MIQEQQKTPIRKGDPLYYTAHHALKIWYLVLITNGKPGSHLCFGGMTAGRPGFLFLTAMN